LYGAALKDRLSTSGRIISFHGVQTTGMDQHHEDPFIQGRSIITSGTQDTRNNRKVSGYGPSISCFSGGRVVTPGTTNVVGESRDDGDQQQSRQLEEQKPNSTIADSSASSVGNRSDSDTSSRRDYTSSQQNRGLHHGHSSLSSSSHATSQLEWLLQQREQLTERLQELETQFESLQKQKAFEKSMFAMKRGQLMVEIEGLHEDNVFLTRKRDKLGRKLLAMHLKRVERMESDEQIKEERERGQIQRSGSQTSF
jgi:hypothetical protein